MASGFTALQPYPFKPQTYRPVPTCMGSLVTKTVDESPKLRQLLSVNLQDNWRLRAEACKELWNVPMTVLLSDRVIGMQGIRAESFPTLRTVHTASYLSGEVQGKGIGQTMRAMLLEFAFGYLGAREANSGYMPANEASRKISERLGYVSNGVEILTYRGTAHESTRLLLTAERWKQFRPPWLDQLEVAGSEKAQQFLV